jgi:hypothetical protein
LSTAGKTQHIVVEMTDAEAYRELLLSNAQSDLKPLEIGMHVLKTVTPSKGGRGKKGGGVGEYANGMGINHDSMHEYVQAARVARILWARAHSLMPYTKSLSIIHRADETDWPLLVARMLSGGWSTEQTGRHALAATTKYGADGGTSIAKYAERVGGRKEQTIRDELHAFEVYSESTDVRGLSKYFSQLVVIHSAPRTEWPKLARRADAITRRITTSYSNAIRERRMLTGKLRKSSAWR